MCVMSDTSADNGREVGGRCEWQADGMKGAMRGLSRERMVTWGFLLLSLLAHGIG